MGPEPIVIKGEASGVDAAFKHAGEVIEHFGHAMHAAEGAFAFDKVKDVFEEVVAASARAEAAQRKFEGAMRASGNAADPAKFYELAESLEQTTTFSKTTTIEAASMFARFKVGQGEISKLLPRVQDLAAFMGTDLVSASDAMGRAISTGGEGLRALGLGFSTTEKKAFQLGTEQERVAMLMQKMSSFAGTAAAMTQTATGAQAQMRNSLEGLAEVFGKIIDKPVAMFFQSINEVVQQVTEWFNQLSPDARDMVAAFAEAVGVIGAVAAGFTALSGGIGVVMGFMPAIVAGVGALGGVFGGVLIPILAVGAAFVGMHAIWVHVLDSTLGDTSDFVADIKDLFSGIGKWIHDTFGTVLTFVSDQLIKLHGMIADLSPEEIAATLNEAHKEQGGLFSNPTDALEKSGKAVGEEIKSSMDDASEFMQKVMGGVLGQMKRLFNIDLLGMIKGLGGKAREPEKIAADASKKTVVEMTLKDLFAGKPLGLAADFSKQGADKLTGAMGGGSAGQKAASEFVRDMVKITGATEDSMTTIITAMAKSGASGDKIAMDMATYADQLSAAQASQTEAMNKIAVYWASMAGQMQKAAAATQGGLQQFGTAMLGAMGEHGATITSAIKMLDDGNWIGAIIAVLKDILTETVAFQSIVELLGGVFNTLSNAIGPLLYAIVELMEVVQALFKSLKPLWTLIGMLGKLLANVIVWIADLFGANISLVNNDMEAFGAGLTATKSNVDLLNQSMSNAENIPEGFKTALNRFNSIIPGSGQIAGNSVTTNQQAGLPTGAWIQNLISTIKDFFTNLGTWWSTAIGTWTTNTNEAWQAFSTNVRGGWTSFTQNTAAAWSSFTAGASAAWNGFRSAVQQGWTAFGNQLNAAWSRFTSGFQTIINNIHNFFVGVGNKLGINVGDALITSSGQVIQFHPDDNILAMKSMPFIPGQAGGGLASSAQSGGVTHINNPIVNVSTMATDPKAVAKAVRDSMANLAYLRSGVKSQPDTRTQYGV